MKFLTPLILATALVLATSPTTHAQTPAAVGESGVQQEIEASVRKVIGTQLSEGEFFVYAKVKLDAEKAAEGGGPVSDVANLPFSPLKVERDYLQDVFNRSRGLQPNILDLELSLVFDQRVPKEKVDLLVGVIRDRFGIDDKARRMTVRTLSLVSEPVQSQQKLVLEKSKLESERALLELEQARTRFDVERREAELADARRKLEEERRNDPAAAAAPKPDEKAAPKPEEKAAAPATPQPVVQVPKEKGPLDYLESFQLLILALIGAGAVLLFALIGAGSLRRGMTSMAEAVTKISEGLGAAAKSASPGVSPVAAAAVGGASAGNVSVTQTGNVTTGAAGGDGLAAPVDRSLDEFLTATTEKLRILMEEKSYGFYRHFIDMVENADTRKMAAAILLTIDEKAARTLLTSLSPTHIESLKDYLSRPGALADALRAGKASIQEFYGRIAAEEFAGSPLLGLKSLDWLVGMDNDKMAEFTLGLEPKDRAGFLACLTPARVNAMISAVKEPGQREELIKSLRELDQVSESEIAATIRKLGARLGDQTAERAAARRPAVNTAKYLAQIAEGLGNEERAVLMNEIGADQELAKRVREHFVPFSAVKALPKAMLDEIFGTRPDVQIAQIIYDTDDTVRAKVLSSLPEIRRENVKAELDGLAAAKFFDKRNRKVSAQLQSDICRYLLGLYREGLLDLDGTEDETPKTGGREDEVA